MGNVQNCDGCTGYPVPIRGFLSPCRRLGYIRLRQHISKSILTPYNPTYWQHCKLSHMSISQGQSGVEDTAEIFDVWTQTWFEIEATDAV
jgi:hypothetical protein